MGKLALEHVAFVILMILTFHNFNFQNLAQILNTLQLLQTTKKQQPGNILWVEVCHYRSHLLNARTADIPSYYWVLDKSKV